MSRPRKPFGPNPPGRLPATMIKVLAAELSDQGRLSRGRRYWADEAVTDIVVGHGVVTAEVLGSRQPPYVVTLEASAGEGFPAKRDLWVRCTCPDDRSAGTDACKHAVAALFALSDEVSIEPDLIKRWRTGRRRPGDTGDTGDTDVVAELPTPPQQQHRDTRDEDNEDDDSEVEELGPSTDPDVDQISLLLQSPSGVSTPVFLDPEPLDHGVIRDGLLAEVLQEAIDQLSIRWE